MYTNDPLTTVKQRSHLFALCTAIEKLTVNARLAPLSAQLSNKNCFLLDGASCNSVKALLACPTQKRSKDNVFVPNICTATYMEMEEKGLCTTFHGSARAFMDSYRHLRFGLIYLDYCSRIGAGYGSHVEKSPICDLETVFRYHLPDTSGCILSVCICKEDKDSSRLDSPQLLRHIVSYNASIHGYACILSETRFDFAGMYTDVFYISSPECARQFYDHGRIEHLVHNSSVYISEESL
jgi:hypothetical protein